jgi:hypothetical protein
MLISIVSVPIRVRFSIRVIAEIGRRSVIFVRD